MRKQRWQRGSLKRQWNGSRFMWVGQWWESGHRRSQTLGACNKMTRGAALAMLAQILEPINASLSDPIAAVMSFDQFVHQVYLPEQRQTWKASTAATAESNLKTLLLPALGSRPMQAIRRAELQRLLGALAAEHTQATLKTVRAWLSGIFKLALCDGLIRTDPTTALNLPRHCKEIAEQPPLTVEQVQQYLGALDLRERCIARLAIFEGMRPGEILALRWRDVGAIMIGVERRVYHGKLDTPKNGSGRESALSAGSRELLAEYRGTAPIQGEDDYIFPSETLSSPAWRTTVWTTMQRQLRSVGLEWATFRVLRRTNASLMHAAGVDPKVSAEQRGHGLGVSLEVYTRIAPKEKAKAMRKLEQAIEPQRRQKKCSA